MNYGWEITKIILYLGIVLGLIYILVYFMKNRMLKQSNNKYIDILERVYISPKVTLSLIKVNKRIILLSISENKVKKIDSWSSDDFIEIEIEDNKEFKDYIQEFLNRKGSLLNRRDNDEE